jgi:hypothetical protein
LIVAISTVSESGDHYLFCETGTSEEIVAKIKSLEDFAYLQGVTVEPLQKSEYESAEALRKEIRKAIDKAQDDL